MSASVAASRLAKLFWSPLLSLLAVSLVAASCGAVGNTATEPGQGEPSATAGQAVGCEDGAGAIAALLGSGLPTYDYDPAVNLDELVASSDLVVSGSLHSALRVAGPTDDAELEPVESQFTQLEAGDWEVLSPGDGSADEMADVFLLDSWWAGGEGEDPLGSEVRFVDAEVRYVAFLHLNAHLPAPRVDVQGLVIGCDDSPAVPVVAPLPADGAGIVDCRLGRPPSWW